MTDTVKTGRFYGVGLGPGDPELLTLKACNLLRRVPVIFVPRKSEGSDSIAETIVNGLSPEMAPKITGLVLPMLRDREKLAQYWRQAADTVWQCLAQGKDCAFVNVGDPLLYGTFIHVMDALRENHPEVKVSVVPGVSSVNAAAAGAVVPLSREDDNIAIISGQGEDDFIRETLGRFETVVFLKVSSIFSRLLEILKEMGLADNCVYVKRATTGEEEIVRDIGSLAGKKLDYFSLLIVRKRHDG